jgi:hypothetical protein
MKILVLFFAVFIATSSNAVVKRHDIPSRNYVLEKVSDHFRLSFPCGATP